MQPPIADPNGMSGAKSSAISGQKFRFRLLPFFLWTTLSCLVLVGPILAAIIYPVFARHPEKFVPAMAIAIAAVALLSFFVCALCYWSGPIRVSHWGLRAFSYWSVPHEFAWSEIASVQFLWRGYSYIVVHAASGRKIWIVWPLQNPREFAQAVAAHTTPDHPLHAFLRGRGWLD